MRRASLAVVVLALATGACGRFGFDAERTATDAAAPPPADAPPPPVDAAPQIACDQPSAGSGMVNDADDDNQLAVGATPTSVIAVSADSTQALRLWTFAIGAGGSVTPVALGTTLDTDSTGTLGVLQTPDGVLVTSSYANGTKLYPLTADGSPRALPTVTSAWATTGSLAPSGIDGTLAFLSYGDGNEIDAQLVDSTGTAIGSPQMIIPGAIGAGTIVIAPAGTGYVVTWTDPSQSPPGTGVELLGADLSIVAGPLTASTNTHGSEVGTVAYASVSKRYLVAWQNKDDTDADEVQIREYDESLTPLTPTDATILTNTGHPQLASDGTGFSLTARSWGPDKLVRDYIGADGTVTPEADTADANALSWATTQHGDQPVVSWLTAGQLWVDAPCAQ